MVAHTSAAVPCSSGQQKACDDPTEPVIRAPTSADSAAPLNVQPPSIVVHLVPAPIAASPASADVIAAVPPFDPPANDAVASDSSSQDTHSAEVVGTSHQRSLTQATPAHPQAIGESGPTRRNMSRSHEIVETSCV